MSQDVKSNYSIVESHAAKSVGAGSVNGASVDHADASGVSFFISVGTVGSSGTIDAKTQYSDDNVTFTDYPANDEAKNDNAITQIVAAASAQLNVPNPRGRYSRVVLIIGTAASVVGITAVSGPLRHIDA